MDMEVQIMPRLSRRRVVVFFSFAVWLGAAALACGPSNWRVIKSQPKLPVSGGDAQLASESVPPVSR
jgi:hypothetical protein